MKSLLVCFLAVVVLIGCGNNVEARSTHCPLILCFADPCSPGACPDGSTCRASCSCTADCGSGGFIW
ncbi:hypothetical protein CHS0354_030004 [Potamilus streckersoni]|uniref:Uncharacterized protein n=1 Tax=Potamilus streckersoni TaxID=2493646 RepID=A0AAE0VZ20_9BIVA|nr:hypothetical protein CHS0354_030004 [Potamilus streckersoni]